MSSQDIGQKTVQPYGEPSAAAIFAIESLERGVQEAHETMAAVRLVSVATSGSLLSFVLGTALSFGSSGFDPLTRAVMTAELFVTAAVTYGLIAFSYDKSVENKLNLILNQKFDERRVTVGGSA